MSGAQKEIKNCQGELQWFSDPESVDPFISKAVDEGATLPSVPEPQEGEQMSLLTEYRRFDAANKFMVGQVVDARQV